ncbi:MAG TPA: hypothetical protein VM123_12545 [archaeon]|nr:hypothetical protein [archaeon]
MSTSKHFILCGLSTIFLITGQAKSQGPKTAYFYNPATELPWASCNICFDGGSRQKIPFLPVVNSEKRAPCGSERYSKDIDVKGTLVFIGNGIVKENEWDSYDGVDVKNKIAMFCYDFPDRVHAKLESEISTEDRINEAISRGALAVVLFSYIEQYPFLIYRDMNGENTPEIPVVTINKNGAQSIFESAYLDSADIFNEWKNNGSVRSHALITKMAISIESKFSRIETENFIFFFRESYISREQIEKLADINEKSIAFNLNLFKNDKLVWRKTFTAYFRDYDSKLFFVHHWGRGFSSGGSTYMVYDGEIPDYGLAVHENAHELINGNWGNSTSFMDEGIAMYAEAQAVDKDKNHLQVIQYLKQGELFPVKEMLTLDIGSSNKTHIAYPVSGSFIEFLIRSYSLRHLKEAFKLEIRPEEEKRNEDTWIKVFGKSIDELEKEWLHWLDGQYGIPEKVIRKH